MGDLNSRRLIVWVILSIAILASIMQVSALELKTGQIRGHSDGGWAIADATVDGLTPGATAFIGIIGFSFTSDSPSQGSIGIWTQRPYGNGWDWGLEQRVNANGQAIIRFIGLYNDKKPFDFLVNYLVITINDMNPSLALEYEPEQSNQGSNQGNPVEGTSNNVGSISSHLLVSHETIKVNSNIGSSWIYIDGTNTSKKTPADIEFPKPRQYTISLVNKIRTITKKVDINSKVKSIQINI